MKYEEPTARQLAARRRVARELAENPNKYKDLGRIGGAVKVPKGVAKLTKTARYKRAKDAARHKYAKEVS